MRMQNLVEKERTELPVSDKDWTLEKQNNGKKQWKSAKRARKRKHRRRSMAGFTIIAVLALLFLNRNGIGVWGGKRYTGKDFGIKRAVSPVDFNHNGKDDYADILAGAKEDAKNHPRYDGTYCQGGYPPDDVGVCSDVVWRAFKKAGYCLRDMVDQDISRSPWEYPAVKNRDSNIDFRRVKNLRVFFDKYAQPLTTDINAIEEWQPGDIVIFGANEHIGIVSDRRNSEGRTYMLHNGGQPNREEDCLGSEERAVIAAHYRFDASAVPSDVLIPWQD